MLLTKYLKLLTHLNEVEVVFVSGVVVLVHAYPLMVLENCYGEISVTSSVLVIQTDNF